MISIPQHDMRDCLIYIFRYCLTRNTYAVGTAQDVILKNINELSEHDLELYIREIKDAKELYVGAFEIDKSWDYIISACTQELRHRHEAN